MKSHGTFTTQSQLEAFLSEHNVSSGKPTDIRVGDYFTLGTYWVYIAGIDTEYHKGVSTHHITCIATLGNSKMNETNTTAGGYEGAAAMQSFLSSKETELTAICGSHLLSRSALTTIAVTDGKSSNWAWTTHKLTLMSETQICGSIQWGNAYDTGEGCEKLPIFNYSSPLQLFGKTSIWLRSVGNATDFCFSSGSGLISCDHASVPYTIIPLFCLG